MKKHDGEVACVVGLGYVGLPLARALARNRAVIGYDVDAQRIEEFSRAGLREDEGIAFTADPTRIAEANFVIICVPTPVTRSGNPDLSHVENAARTVSRNLKPGSVVVLESTVYPGATEEVMLPILEESGMVCGRDFKVAYSPERINPGDTEHDISRVTKVVAGMDAETTDLVADLYGEIAPSVFRAKGIRVAEAAKVIENIQRDLNLALVNELAIIFGRMGLNTRDVLDAAETKWNFHRYSPGMVGGHCIPVDPYYLVHKAEELGYHPQVILAGRATNDSMPKHVADMTVRALNDVGKVIKGSRVLIMGLTYKENVADIRETPAKDIITELRGYGVELLGYDPLLGNVEGEFGIRFVSDIDSIAQIDGVILTVAHDAFSEISLDRLRGLMGDSPVLIDVRGVFSREEAEAKRFTYRTL